MAFKTTYLICGRIGEVICLTIDSDRNVFNVKPKHTGYQLSVSEATYCPDPESEDERELWMLKFALQGKQLSLSELAEAMRSIEEPVAVFTVYTEKRGGLKREIALPLDKRYDPWVSEVYEYLQNKEPPYYPFNRQEMWATAREAFDGLKYTIIPYKRAKIIEGQYVRDAEKNLVRDNVPEHLKPFGDQAIRHLRASELRNFYKLTREERAAFGGWAAATVAGGSTAQDRYEESPWRTWFPKLLKKRV